MRKTLLTSFALLAAGYANAQLTNLGLETWSGGDPSSWQTINFIATGSVTQITTGASEGLSAASVKVVSCPFCGLASLPDPMPGFLSQQAAYTARPTAFTFKWKGNVAIGDTSVVIFQLDLAGNPIGSGSLFVNPGTTQSTWKSESIAINYFGSSNPDSASIVVLADVIMPGVAGSSSIFTYIDVDAFVLTGGTTGVDLLKTDNPLIVAYPNPASTEVNFNLVGTDAFMFEVMDVTGKVVYSENNVFSKHVLSLDSFTAGMYLVRFYNTDKNYVGAAKLTVVK